MWLVCKRLLSNTEFMIGKRWLSTSQLMDLQAMVDDSKLAAFLPESHSFVKCAFTVADQFSETHSIRKSLDEMSEIQWKNIEEIEAKIFGRLSTLCSNIVIFDALGSLESILEPKASIRVDGDIYVLDIDFVADQTLDDLAMLVDVHWCCTILFCNLDRSSTEILSTISNPIAICEIFDEEYFAFMAQDRELLESFMR